MSVGKYLTELKHYTKFRRLPVQTAIAAGDGLKAQPRYKTPGNHWLNIAQKRNNIGLVTLSHLVAQNYLWCNQASDKKKNGSMRVSIRK